MHQFRGGKARPSFGILALAQRAYRQHVLIRPVSRPGVAAPLLRALEHGLEQRPVVPEVVRHAPHGGPGLEVLGLLQRRGAGGEGKHDVPAAAPGGFGDDLDLPPAARVLPGDVVALDEIDAPGGVQAEDTGIVVRGGFRIRPGAVHVRIPGADVVGIGRVPAAPFAVLDGQLPLGGFARDAAHDVDAEFQPQAVYVIRQRPEALPVLRGRETVDGWLQPAPAIQGERGERRVGVVDGGGLIPLDIDHDVLPAVFLQMGGHVFRVFAYGLLGDCRSPAVPAVPAHGRILCDHLDAS